jgi:hypothetical protein
VGLSLNRNNQKAENISVKPNYMFPVRILDWLSYWWWKFKKKALTSQHHKNRGEMRSDWSHLSLCSFKNTVTHKTSSLMR